MKKRILITGANGFIGQNIVSKLTKSEYVTLGIDNKANDFNESEVKQCDVTDEKALNHTLDEFKPQIIIHCAAIKNLPECEENKLKSAIINVLSTEHLANYSKKINLN